MEEEGVEFFGKYGDWVCIKKAKVTSETKPVDVARILTSIQNSIDRKKWDFLEEDIKVSELSKIAAAVAGLGDTVLAKKRDKTFVAGLLDKYDKEGRLYLKNARETNKKGSEKLADLGDVVLDASELLEFSSLRRGKATDQVISENLARVSSPNTGGWIKKLVPTPKAQELAKTFVTREVFEILNFRLSLDVKKIDAFVEEKEKVRLASEE